MVIYMKKYLYPMITSLLIGSLFAYFIISNYESAEAVTVSKDAQTLYYAKAGEFKTKEEMEEKMKNLENYIYSVEDNMYCVYVGITTNKKNFEKIKGFYEKKLYDISERQKITDNTKFIKILNQYDNLLSQTDDEKSIGVIENQVLAKYEEMINNEY